MKKFKAIGLIFILFCSIFIFPIHSIGAITLHEASSGTAYGEVVCDTYNVSGLYTGVHWDTAASGNANPRGLGTDGTNIWVVDLTDDEVYKYTIDGTYISSFDTHASGNGDPIGLGTDGTNIYVTDYWDDEVYKYTMTGTYVSSFDIAASGNANSFGLGTDGTNIWVTDSNAKV